MLFRAHKTLPAGPTKPETQLSSDCSNEGSRLTGFKRLSEVIIQLHAILFSHPQTNVTLTSGCCVTSGAPLVVFIYAELEGKERVPGSTETYASNNRDAKYS